MSRREIEPDRLKRELEALDGPEAERVPEDPVEFCRNWLNLYHILQQQNKNP